MRISAPGYEAKAVPVVLKPHANRIASPIDLSGIEIADLQYFIVFQSFEGNDVVAELRDGMTIGIAKPRPRRRIRGRLGARSFTGEESSGPGTPLPRRCSDTLHAFPVDRSITTVRRIVSSTT